MKTAIVVLSALALLGACAEETQELPAAGEPGYRSDAWPDQARERTLRQDEGRRIYH